jgi:hypothetical protein
MTEPLTDEELGLDPAQMEALDPNIRAELRRSRQLARDAQAATERSSALERELAFTKAGIPDTPLGQMFAKAYDGDTADPTAIKTAFEALGVAGEPSGQQTPPPPEGASEQELEAQRRIAQAGSGAEGDGSVPYEEAIRAAKNPSEVLALIAQAPPTALDDDGRRIAIAEVQ